GVCVAAAAVAMTMVPSSAEDASAAHDEYNATVIDALLAEGTPRTRVLAATAMKYGGKQSSAEAERQRELLSQAVQAAPDDAWVQWIAAVYALPSDTVSEPALALQRLEPDNGAIWLFQLAAASRANDSTGVTDALARIGASSRFDDHFVDYALEWLEFSRKYPLPDSYATGDNQASAQLPLVMAVSRAAALAMPNYVSPTRACKAVDQPLKADRREACIAAGRVMLTESNTLDSMRLGAAMLQLAGADDAAEVTRNTDYFTEEYLVLWNAMLRDPEEFKRYQVDWVQSRDTLQAARNLLLRAGVPLLPPPNWKSEPSRLTSTSSRQPNA
ncbi:hypothetical protein, partial [Dokdonella sp.]|uniref:hypothetical protein n=1 Tax=Dokdonella sp. TaxID=2291710 RepID=UPI003C52688A